MFTVEEITLLRSFDTSTRRTAILSLMNEMGHGKETGKYD